MTKTLIVCLHVALLLVTGACMGSAAGSEGTTAAKGLTPAGAAKPASGMKPGAGKAPAAAADPTAAKNRETERKAAATTKPMGNRSPSAPRQPAKVLTGPPSADKGEPPSGRKTEVKPAVDTDAARKEKKRPHPVARRCEPQSLTYARQRSGIMTCRNGRENGPMTWFAAEKKAGRTSPEPVAGCVLILKGQGHGMPTGHVAYVEEVFPESPTSYRLIFSHTNYDRRCSMETNIEATYDRAAMTLEVRSGAWRAWGRGLKVAGFIHDRVAVAAAPESSGAGETTSQGRTESIPPVDIQEAAR